MGLIGKAVTRREDDRFVRGRGLYAADLDLPGALVGVFLRAPVAFGAIRGVDTADALAVPGVVAVLTGADAAADGLGHVPTGFMLDSRDGTPLKVAHRPVLPDALVHHVGQPVALVLAETRAAALDALERIGLDIDEQPPAMDGAAEPAIHEGVAANLAFDWEAGSFEDAERAVDAAPRQAAVSFRQNRMVGAAVEGRVAVGEYVAGDDSVTLHLACQGAHTAQVNLGRAALGWPKEKLRVRVHDVGGGFGPKFFAYPEQAAVAWAARRLKRHVVWVSERTESFVSEAHARDQKLTARLGFDGDGRFLAVSVSSDADMGAFLSSYAAGVPTDGLAKVLTGLYDIPAAGLRVRGYYSNTVPVDAYRGAGKPPGVYVLERLADLAAAELGLDRAEIRRRNLIRPEALPHRTPLGKVLDAGGDYPAALEKALGAGDWTGFEARAGKSAAQGLRRGIGVACNLHGIGGSTNETSRVTVGADGRITAWTGTQSTGQGHETVYAQILAERLDLPFDAVRVRQGDTSAIRRGGGSGGSSSTTISGTTLARTADEVIRIARERASDKLEAAADDIDYAGGVFTVVGTDRRVSLAELAADSPIEAERDFEGEVSSFPYGAIVAEVEIDPETGAVRLERLVSCDDAGRIVNPTLLHGQSQGALVQGAGQALMEHAVYDRESGQLIAGSFMDYAMPRAADLPPIETGFIETLTPTSELGIRGIGELGANGAPAAIAAAVRHALADIAGIDRLEPPFSPDRVWRAIRGGGST